MNKEIIMFVNIKNIKRKFHCYKNVICFDDVDIYNIFISKKISSGEYHRYFIGYMNSYKIK